MAWGGRLARSRLFLSANASPPCSADSSTIAELKNPADIALGCHRFAHELAVRDQHRVHPPPPTHGHQRRERRLGFFRCRGSNPAQPIRDAMYVGVDRDPGSTETGGKNEVGALGADTGKREQAFHGAGYTALFDQLGGYGAELFCLLAIEASSIEEPAQSRFGELGQGFGCGCDGEELLRDSERLLVPSAGADEAGDESLKRRPFDPNTLIHRGLRIASALGVPREDSQHHRNTRFPCAQVIYSIRFNTSCAVEGRSMMTLSPSTLYLAPSRLASSPYQTAVF